MASDTEGDLAARVHALARCQDDHDFDGYLAAWAEDGRYRIEVRAPELEQPMVWMAMTREELRQRLESLDRHEWQIARSLELTRLVSVDRIETDGDGAATSTTFAVYSTDEEGRSALYAVGRYEDDWERQSGEWRLRQRLVALKTRMLPTPTPLPI